MSVMMRVNSPVDPGASAIGVEVGVVVVGASLAGAVESAGFFASPPAGDFAPSARAPCADAAAPLFDGSGVSRPDEGGADFGVDESVELFAFVVGVAGFDAVVIASLPRGALESFRGAPASPRAGGCIASAD